LGIGVHRIITRGSRYHDSNAASGKASCGKEIGVWQMACMRLVCTDQGVCQDSKPLTMIYVLDEEEEMQADDVRS
jgi:hypothetical protein